MHDLGCSRGTSAKAQAPSHSESPTARRTCGAVPAEFPLWCVCMNPAAGHPTAVAMGPVWTAVANAPAASGGVTPAASWTAAPPTAASMGCAQRVSGEPPGGWCSAGPPRSPVPDSCLCPYLASTILLWQPAAVVMQGGQDPTAVKVRAAGGLQKLLERVAWLHAAVPVPSSLLLAWKLPSEPFLVSYVNHLTPSLLKNSHQVGGRIFSIVHSTLRTNSKNQSVARPCPRGRSTNVLHTWKAAPGSRHAQGHVSIRLSGLPIHGFFILLRS